jgi:hypothetical protein
MSRFVDCEGGNMVTAEDLTGRRVAQFGMNVKRSDESVEDL